MKKIIFILFCLPLSIFSQVSTIAENKNVVLEQFTGIIDGYSPVGHLIAQQFHDANSGDVILINIHASGFAQSQGPGTDFSTDFGEDLLLQSGSSCLPSATINREVFGSLNPNPCTGDALLREDYAIAGNIILAEPSPVNMWGNAVVDLGANTLTVDVEVYYTGNQTVNSNKLHVAILQNNIEGPQSGASGNPTAVLPNGNYNHQHMLRHLMTGQWGETINTISQGTMYTDQFVWNIPADINGVAVDPTDLAVAIFVSEGQEGILSGAMADFNIVFPNTDDAKFSSSLASNLTCTSATTDLTVTFQNYASVPLTSLDIEYSINGGIAMTYPWTGNLISGGFETVNIPNVSLTDNADNTVDFTLVNPNGNADQNTTNNTQEVTFKGVSPVADGEATIIINTDAYGSETTWTLKDGNGSTIASGGPYTNTVQTHQETVSLNASECYTFNMIDSYGDGIISPGSYKVEDANGSIVVWGGTNSPNGNFTDNEMSYFGYVAPSTNSANNIAKNLFVVYPNPAKEVLTIDGVYKTIEILDIYGKIVLTSNSNKTINVSSLASGIYTLNILTENKVNTQKITIIK